MTVDEFSVELAEGLAFVAVSDDESKLFIVVLLSFKVCEQFIIGDGSWLILQVAIISCSLFGILHCIIVFG